MTSAGAKPHRERLGDVRTAAWKPRRRLARYAASICLLALVSAAAGGRSLEIISERRAFTLLANPDSLPFATKPGPRPLFHIGRGEKNATQLRLNQTRE